ncbi:glucose/arabinose dehydrogenase [Leeuwenhoekiella aestuarii]|uniref:Glucose/arabinose dehydrogenase n=1 Tax=Leeuwenhoekiella aestuarii TaxID=2249426 RepID=A0A4Q0NVJ5_9FLAO|nr:PQQ-dependent sugar dehydrogenase [Leeuwenhoekiella aestuarii]RXG15169.1 glucose/arabinose dehydrogenase [Leeuwenhoekiella aestuarii]RXG17720.1 glucose/arabinose dehydrogenase [Leeuwenhoekiella aestuarii]
MKKGTLVFLALLTTFLACGQNPKEVKANDIPITVSEAYSHEVIVPDLINPWGMAFLPDGSLLVTEKSGELIHFKEGVKTEISGVPEVYNRGQGGLLDIRLSPDYANDNWIYITYSSTEGDEKGGNTALMRAKLSGNSLTDQEVLYKASPNTTKGQHWGSRIVFDNSGHVYFTAGERGERDVNPQDVTRDNGKVYRLNLDGSIPSDNPFVGQANAKAAIWSYGHRNPQGMIIHPETQEIWVHEHGPRGGDEINVIKKGANYGWPVITYGINYSGTAITDETKKEGMEQPLYYWVPSIAPSGMALVTGNKYPELSGNILVGSLKFVYLEALYLANDKVVKREKLLDGIGRVRNVVQGPDGFVYVGVEGVGIVKLIKN